MSWSQAELNAIAYEIMRQEMANKDPDITEKTAARLRTDYFISEESAKIAAQSALDRWTDVYYPY